MKRSNIWKDLPKPLFVQALMDGATDTVFRQMIASCGRPDIFFTEFANVEGIFSPGVEHVGQRLQFAEIEKPIIAQIWGSTPENFYKAAKHLAKLGFDGIDINMGCPVRDVVKKGLCSALIDNHDLAGKIIKATQEGAGNLPVSVKTRIGLRSIATETWFPFLLSFGLDAIIVHGRTSKEMSLAPVHWDEVAKVVVLRDNLPTGKGKETVIIGNGDIKTRSQGLEIISKYGLDGVMIGRGIFDDIGVFDLRPAEERPLDIRQRYELLERHLKIWIETWGSKEGFQPSKQVNELKRFVKVYIKDFDGASDMRVALMECHTYEEMMSVIDGVLRGAT